MTPSDTPTNTEQLRDRIILAITNASVSWSYISDDSDDAGPMMTTRDALLDALGMTLEQVFVESNRLLRSKEQEAWSSDRHAMCRDKFAADALKIESLHLASEHRRELLVSERVKATILREALDAITSLRRDAKYNTAEECREIARMALDA